ncbi:cell wall metabolism sensor histidine kinase WalK [Aeromicrobium sp. YIM 150415]|uniref:sensor histidine kinase n=1 Tax=Aeromicrobium sp. YIM 150415 TaxID=2803912 RepID=UPI001964DC43|nr:HAMP domain-containing sensor histidine kinase [Aeromicrobium sp. YIM 150415]
MSSVRARITLGASLIVAAVLVAGAMLFTWTLERTLTSSVADAAERSADALARTLDEDDDRITGTDDDDLVQLLDEDGTVRASNDEASGLPAITDPDGDERTIEVDGDRFVVVTSSAEDGVLALGVPLDDVEDSVDATRGLLWIAVPVLVVLVAGVTWVTVGRSLRPVERMRGDVAGIGASDLTRRVRVPPGRDEIPRLARTMNAMLERLDASSRQQRQFVSDASHELRSPIAAMRQSAEVLQRHPSADLDLPATVLAETDRLDGLVSAMLVLARSDEHGLALRRQPVDVDDLVLAETTRLRAAGLEVDGSAIAPARIDADRRLLGQVVRNLADNAARHARTAVAFSVSEGDGRATITVDDDGDGIAAADRERVFGRFVRLDEGRARDAGGSGLGLAIVAEVVRAHGGRVGIDDSRLGGARFTVQLPVHPPETPAP